MVGVVYVEVSEMVHACINLHARICIHVHKLQLSENISYK